MSPRTALVLLGSIVMATLAGNTLATTPYIADVNRSSLGFTFVQAGAKSRGSFKSFDARLAFDPQAPEQSQLYVAIRVASLDTQDSERDELLRGADLFDAARHPQARFSATRLVRSGPDRYEAIGKLTIRGVTREQRVPFTLSSTNENGKQTMHMKGATVIRRLDFGVGKGEWESTEWVANDVTVSFDLRLVPGEAQAGN